MKQNRLGTKAGWPDSGELLSFSPFQHPSLPTASQLPLGLRLSSQVVLCSGEGEVGLVEGTKSRPGPRRVRGRLQPGQGGPSLGLWLLLLAPIFLKTRFIVVKFTSDTINHFKVNASVAFSTTTTSI